MMKIPTMATIIFNTPSKLERYFSFSLSRSIFLANHRSHSSQPKEEIRNTSLSFSLSGSISSTNYRSHSPQPKGEIISLIIRKDTQHPSQIISLTKRFIAHSPSEESTIHFLNHKVSRHNLQEESTVHLPDHNVSRDTTYRRKQQYISRDPKVSRHTTYKRNQYTSPIPQCFTTHSLQEKPTIHLHSLE